MDTYDRQKNLPLNSHSRVCSDHFVNSSGLLLRNKEFSTGNLPTLPTQVTLRPRKPPRQRYLTSNCGHCNDSESGYNSELLDITFTSLSDASTNCDLTVCDMLMLEAKIVHLNFEIEILKSKIASSKFCLNNLAARNKVAYYTGFPSIKSLNACYEYLGPAVNNLTYWNGGKSKAKVAVKVKADLETSAT